jgi:hypothetical protein
MICIVPFLSNRSVDQDMKLRQALVDSEQPSSNGERTHDMPEDVLNAIAAMLWHICGTTGFGDIAVEIKRIKGEWICVIVRAGVSKRFTISDKDVRRI